MKKTIIAMSIAALSNVAIADVNTDHIDSNVNMVLETPKAGISNEGLYTLKDIPESLKSYFSETMDKESLNQAIQRVRQRMAYTHQSLGVNINPETHEVTFKVSSKSSKKSSAFMVLDTDGPRYAGPNLLTVGGSLNGVVPNSRVTAYVTEGLKGRDTTKDSVFRALSLKADTAFNWGTSTIGMNYSDNAMVQNDAVGEQTSTTSKIYASFVKPLKHGFTLEGGVQTTKTKSALKDFELSDTVTYSSANVKMSASHSLKDANVQWSVEREEGLGTSRKGDATIQGKVANSWHTNTYEMAFQKGNVSTKVGYQESSEGTPSAAMGYIGGPGRGSSFDAGTYSGDAVSYYDVRYTFQPIKNVLPFVSINGGATDKEHISSLQVGGSVNVWGGALRASLSQTLEGDKIKNNGKTRLSVNFTKAF